MKNAAKDAGNLKFATPSAREIVITRAFNAPRARVFDAWTKPELVKRWMLGPPGWTMPVCEIDLKVGGRYRYEWRKDNGAVMGMGGVYREVKAPERWVATEKFDDAWYPGEAVGTNVLVEQGGTTLSTFTIRYDSREARRIALKSGMEDGMKAGYARLDALLAAPPDASPRPVR